MLIQTDVTGRVLAERALRQVRARGGRGGWGGPRRGRGRKLCLQDGDAAARRTRVGSRRGVTRLRLLGDARRVTRVGPRSSW